MIQRGIIHDLCIEGLYSLGGRQLHKSSLMFMGRLSEEMTPKLDFKGCIDIDHEKTEEEITSRRKSGCQISQDGQINVQH